MRECLRAPGFRAMDDRRHTKGAAVRGINLGDVKLIPIIIPPLPLQREFAAQVSAVERLKTAQRTSLKKLGRALCLPPASRLPERAVTLSMGAASCRDGEWERNR